MNLKQALANRPLSFATFILLSLSALLYLPFLHNPYFFDDYFYDFINREINPQQEPVLTYNLRSLPYATFTWTRSLFGTYIFWLRLGNYGLHLATVFSLFVFLRCAFNLTLSTAKNDKLPATHLALGGALIFALHPLMVFAVGYLNQRTLLMATLFSLLSWNCILFGLQRQRLLWFSAALLSYALAVLSKETAIMAPTVVLGLLFLLKQYQRQNAIALLLLFCGYAVIATQTLQLAKAHHVLGAAYQVNAQAAMDKLGIAPSSTTTAAAPAIATPTPAAVSQPAANAPVPPPSSAVAVTPVQAPVDLSHVYSIITESWLFFHYLGFWLCPNISAMAIDMYYPFVTQLDSWPEILGFIGFLLYPVLAGYLLFQRGTKGLLGLGLLAPWLLFIPEFATIRVQEALVLYRSYLWLPATLLALPFLCQQLRLQTFISIISLVSVLLFSLSWQQLHTFADPIQLWADAGKLIDPSKERIPGVERVFYNRGLLLEDKQRPAEAIADLSTAIRLANEHSYLAAKAYHHRGLVYFQQGEYQKAIDDFNHAIQLDPKDMAMYVNKGRAYEHLNDPAAAEAAYKQGFMANMFNGLQ